MNLRHILMFSLIVLTTACTGERHEVNRPTVVYLPVNHDVVYVKKNVLPSVEEEKSLRKFLTGSVNNPDGNIAFFAADPFEPVTHERIEALKALLYKKNLTVAQQEVLVVAEPSIPSDRIRVGSSVTRLTTSDCPNWYDGEHATNYGNTTLPNFGCASAHNLGMALEDPNDYLRGRGHSGTADAERVTRVFEAYRTPVESITSGEAGDSAAGGN
ncbi:MAG: hypothetical protein FJX23_04570 [Alphaproteobacteria bacterium]|nr:hypothetical protein [Alphaproteobacteria bacterium]